MPGLRFFPKSPNERQRDHVPDGYGEKQSGDGANQECAYSPSDSGVRKVNADEYDEKRPQGDLTNNNVTDQAASRPSKGWMSHMFPRLGSISAHGQKPSFRRVTGDNVRLFN